MPQSAEAFLEEPTQSAEDFLGEAHSAESFLEGDSTVSQMAAATRATIGVVGRAVAASDLARAGMNAETLPSQPEAVATDEHGRPLDPRGRNPAQLNPAWEGVKLSSTTGGEMLMRPLIEIPRIDLGRLGPSQGNVSTGTKVAVGAYNAVAGLAEFPESLLGVSTLAAGGFPEIVQRLVAGGYAIDMARHTPEQVVALARAIEGGDAQEISQTATSLGINVALVGLTAKHALTKVAPLTAEAVTKVAPDPFPQDIAQASQSKPSPTPLTTEAVAKVVEKEPVPPPAPTPTEVVSESGKPAPVTAGVEPPAKQSVTPEVTIAKPEGERALTTVGSRGPGGAASGEPGTYDPASELTDALKTINELDPAKRASDSTRIADLWAAGKSTVEKAWGKVIAAKESLKSNLLTLPEVTPLKKLVGVIDSQLQSSSARSEALGKAFEAAHPSKVRRGGMAIMVDSGMDVERVRAAIAELPANTPRKIRQAFEAAANLDPKEMDAAQRIKGYFDQRLKDAQEAGVLKNFLEDYYTHVWKNTDKMPTELKGAMNSGQVVSYFENARQRKLESFIEGVKLGLEPVLDPSLVLPRYNYNLDRAIASRAFIKKLTGVKEADGRPTAAPTGSASKIENEAGGTDATLIKPSTKSEETGDYKTVDNPALKGWKWVEKDADGNPIMVQGDLAIHPDALERIRNMMDKARLTATAPVRIAIAVGAEVKGAKLGILSPFHQIHVGSHALWHLVNPFNLKAEIDWTLPSTKFATESGVKLAGDFHDRIGFSEGIGPGLIAQKLVPYARAYSEYLFKSFIPRLKLKTFEAVYQRDLKRYAGKATPDQIAARAADAVNSAYGELNRKWLGEDGRDPRLQRALQVGLLAPDFLEARGRFVGKAFTKFGGEERMALFVMGATLYTTARVLNQLLDGDPHAKELNMMFSVRYHGRNYSVRSVLGDTAHLFSDWRSFVAHRINPFTTRTAVEAISGRELRTGLKRDTQEQAEDLLRQITPAQFDSMLPGDRAWYEGLTQSLGVTSVHQPTPAEIKKREANAAKNSKNPPAFEFIYNPAHVKKGGAKK